MLLTGIAIGIFVMAAVVEKKMPGEAERWAGRAVLLFLALLVWEAFTQ